MFRRSLRTHVFYLLPFALTACGEKTVADPRTEAPVVQVATVQGASLNTQSFTGVVGARIQSDLGFRVAGKVLQRLVDTGESVKRGQPLMKIDPIDLGLEAHAQESTVAAARARAKQTSDDEARYRDLVAAGAVSASAYDQIKAASDTAQAQLKAAEAQSGVAKNASSYALLVADSDGVIVETLAEPGQVVSAGQIVLRLAHAGPREAIVQLPETVRPEVGAKADATLYGQDNVVVSAKLRQISDSADRLTRTYEARYVLNGALANAPLGSTVTVRLSGKKSSGVEYQLPAGAITDAGKGTGVWLVTGSPAQVTWRPVQVRGISDDSFLVDGSFQTGDKVVALGAHLLHEGEKVKLAGTASQAPAAADKGEQK